MIFPGNTLNKNAIGLGNVDNLSIITMLNRQTAVNSADTNYTTVMARGESLNSTETQPTANGTIAWVYE